jgi:ubiquinone biosynthesis protein UbiJ
MEIYLKKLENLNFLKKNAENELCRLYFNFLSDQKSGVFYSETVNRLEEINRLESDIDILDGKIKRLEFDIYIIENGVPDWF